MITVTSYRPNGNQLLAPNVSSNVTSAPLISPVSVEAFADWLGVDATDPLLEGLLLSASQAFIDYTRNELLEREWTVRFDRWPEVQAGLSGLGGMHASMQPWLKLPLAPVTAVLQVRRGYDPVEIVDSIDYTVDLRSRPARVVTNWFSSPFIEVDYVAGYPGDSSGSNEVPQDIKTGIMMYADYIYGHRGGCEIESIVKESGAGAVWNRYKMITGGL